MKPYKIGAVILVITILTTISGCFFSFDTPPTNIKNGFSENLIDMLSETYGLNIPSSAVFIKGYYDNAFRDPSVLIAFTVPKDDFDSMFENNNRNWREESNDISSFYEGLFDNEIEFENRYSLGGFTFLFFSHMDGEDTLCAFHGHHPGNPIK